MDAQQTHDHPTPILYDTAGAARRIDARLSPRTMERWRRSGYGPRYVVIGRRVGYTDEAIREWLTTQERRHTQQKV
ncbi:MAG: DNA-binding protein [Acidobacteria bacterium]|nr:DNA-binding protein [Acidobacteriota bacterium]